MTFTELLSIEPQELKFPFELKKLISCSLQLSNRTDNYVAFKVKTTHPKKYCVQPNIGIIVPHSTCDVTVVMQAQREAPADMQCKDKFLIQSVIANPVLVMTAKDITTEMFNKESGNLAEECKLRVVYVAPPKRPLPVLEESEEDSSPLRASVPENGSTNASQFHQAETLITRLAEEKNSAIQLNRKLLQELFGENVQMELLRREDNKRSGRFSWIQVMIIGLLGILLGYVLWRT